MQDIDLLLRRLPLLGESIKHNGFQTEILREACSTYWNLVLEDDIHINKDTIQFVSPDVLESLIDEKRERCFDHLYSLFPIEFRADNSIENIKRVQERSAMGGLEALNIGTVVGHYCEKDDTCYISTSLDGGSIHPEKYKAYIAVHELGHRYVHQKRESIGLISTIPDTFQEEGFCRRLEALFASFVTLKEGKTLSMKSVTASRNMLTPLLNPLLDPAAVFAYTRNILSYYTIMLESDLRR